MTKILRFSISKKHESKVSEAMDKWQKRGPIQSTKICEAIIKLHEEEERGSKLTVWTGQQSKLPLLPAVYEIPTAADLDGLSYNELRTIAMSIKQWDAIVTKRIISEQRLK